MMRFALCLSLGVSLAGCDIGSAGDYDLAPAYDLGDRPGSDNIIDVRGGVPCDNPRNCYAGYAAACDPVSCTQLYNYGTCVADVRNGVVTATTLCQTGPVQCEDVRLCRP